MQSKPYLIKLFITFALLINIAACSDDNTGANTETVSVTEIPEAIQKFTLTTDGALEAWLIIDGTRYPMSINSDAGTATATISGLSRSSHTVSVVYEFTDLNGDTYILADTLPENVDLSSGDASISIDSGDFDTASHDSDGDGISNADEVAAGTDPGDSACLLDTSLLGKCTLG